DPSDRQQRKLEVIRPSRSRPPTLHRVLATGVLSRGVRECRSELSPVVAAEMAEPLLQEIQAVTGVDCLDFMGVNRRCEDLQILPAHPRDRSGGGRETWCRRFLGLRRPAETLP